MKTTINKCDFVDAFHAMDRRDNFNPKGLETLFDYLEQFEEDIGEEIELDVIALCCEYTQYANLKELQSEHSDIESFDDLEANTLVLYCGKYQDEESSFIIQNY